MSDTNGSGGGAPLSDRPGYVEAFNAAVSGPTPQARRAGVDLMERIAAGGMASQPAQSAAPIKALSPAVPVGQTRDATHARYEAAGSDGYQAAFDRAINPRLPASAHDAAVADMATRAAAGELGGAEPAAPAAPEGYEPAASMADYQTPPVLHAADSERVASVKSDLHALGLPGWLGSLALREIATAQPAFQSQAAYDSAVDAARATLARVHGEDEAFAIRRDAHEMTERLPEKLRTDARLLLVSPAVTFELAKLYRLKAIPAAGRP